MILDKSIWIDMIILELTHAAESKTLDNIQFHIEKSLSYYENLVDAVADEYGVETDELIS